MTVHSRSYPAKTALATNVILLILLIAAFVVAKLPHLSYPFYWDESWSYAPGVQLMYQHGPTLLPGEIDTFYSRGHPLGFYASAAAWMSVFGPSHQSMHAFSLAVSVGCLIAVYLAGTRLMNGWAGLLGAGLVACQLIFFVQSAMLLPEVMVALFSLLSLHAWSARKAGWLALWLSCLLFTKESGGVAAIVIGLATGAELIAARFRSRLAWRLSGAVALAGILIGAFFLYQKQVYGWYFFPDHVGYVKPEWGIFYGKFQASLHTLFFDDKRELLFAGLLLAVIGYAGVKRDLSPLLLLLPAGAAYWIEKYTGPVSTKLLFTTWVVAGLIAVAGLLRAYRDRLPGYAIRFVISSAAWWMLYVCFCSLNFITGRYLLSALVVTMLAAAWMLYAAIRSWAGRAAPLFVVLLGGAVALYAFRTDTGLGDSRLGAFDAMRIQRSAVRYLESHGHYDQGIASQCYQTRVHLTNPLAGFRSTSPVFSRVSGEPDSATRFIVFDNIEPTASYDAITRSGEWQRVFRSMRGEAWIEIWERISFRR